MFDSFEEFCHNYGRYISKKHVFLAIIIVLIIISFGAQLGFGKYHISFVDSYTILFQHIFGTLPDTEWAMTSDDIIWNNRLPRALGCIAVGSGLGICGAAMQSSLKNPLADPYTTGISSGASLGASLAIIAGFSLFGGLSLDYTIMVNAFLFALIPSAVIITFTVLKKNASPSMIILVGVAVMFIFSAFTTMLKYTATDDSLADIYFWGLGSMGKVTWDNVFFLLAIMLLGTMFFASVSKKLNILSVCDNNARTMGVDANKLRIEILAVVSIVTAVIVCFTGTIGFVGLIAPHVVRMVIGSDNKYLIPASFATGAFIMLAADCLAKNLTTTGVPVGLITSLIGGPLFLYLLIRRQKSDW